MNKETKIIIELTIGWIIVMSSILGMFWLAGNIASNHPH